jgi:predicted phage terminase large subunit-like protein
MKKRPKISEHRFDQWAEDLKLWIKESVSPFEADSPEKQQERIGRARWDKLFFMQTYLPHYFYGEFGDFHDEWSELGDLKDEVVLRAAPREHAKSTFFTFGDPLHDICFELRRFIIIISDTNNQATGFTLPMRLELEDNPRIRHDFGNLHGPTWAKNDFTTATGVRILARGRGEKVRGLKNRQYRPDKIIVDDFENDTNVRNPQLVKEGIDWLLKAVIGSAGAGFCFIMVGNLFHPKSVLSQLMAMQDEEGRPLYNSRVYRAILDEGTPDERPLWPAVWSLERLKQKRRFMGSVAFNAEMMNLTGAADSPFREEWFKYFSREEAELPPLLVATFCDPSGKSGEANDFKAVITVGLDRAGMKFYCLHAWIRHATVREMFAAIYRQWEEYQSGVVGIEENMYEEFLHEAIENYAKEAGRYPPWKPIKQTGQKEARIIGTLSYLVEHGKLLFEKGHSDQDLLVEQLIYIINATVHDDGPDALEGAVSLLQHGAGPVAYESLAKRRFSEVRWVL